MATLLEDAVKMGNYNWRLCDTGKHKSHDKLLLMESENSCGSPSSRITSAFDARLG
jgi:hypothetical protein